MKTAICFKNQQEHEAVSKKLQEGGIHLNCCAYNELDGYFLVTSDTKQASAFYSEFKCDVVMTADRFLLHPHLVAGWEKPNPKKMTVAEVCTALGYEVEIVK